MDLSLRKCKLNLLVTLMAFVTNTLGLLHNLRFSDRIGFLGDLGHHVCNIIVLLQGSDQVVKILGQGDPSSSGGCG